MNSQFLHKKNNQAVILFFNGWGMDEHAIQHVKPIHADILMLNDYRSLSFDESCLKNYKTIYVIAWSLGVWVANVWMQQSKQKIDRSIAINGTCMPINSGFGIAPDVFQATIDNWTIAGRNKFQLRMFKDRSIYSANEDKLPHRSLENQKEELIFLQQIIQQPHVGTYEWNKIFIGMDDLIIPASNQSLFWKDKNKHISITSMPHYPFLELKSWEDILL